MKSPQLFHARTGNSLRASIACELSGVNAERHFLDLQSQEHKTDAYLQINPAGTVPAFIDYDDNGNVLMTLTQSGAILEYLLAKHRPDLVPADLIERSLTNSAVLAALSDIAIQNGLLVYMSFHDGNKPFLEKRLLNSIGAAFHPLQDTAYFGGASPNIADFAHFPVIFMREELLRNGHDFAHVIEWLDRMKSIEAISTATSYSGIQLPL